MITKEEAMYFAKKIVDNSDEIDPVKLKRVLMWTDSYSSEDADLICECVGEVKEGEIYAT